MHEKEIIEYIINRNEKGIELLLAHYAPLMRYIIAPILPNEQDREECLSEAVMRVWNKIHLFNSELGSWSAWLTALTRNTALNRARHTAQADNTEKLSDSIPSIGPMPEEIILRRERQAAIALALNKLSPKEKALFYRKYYYMQSTFQIACELGMTERAVEGKLYRLKKRLRKMLGGEERE